MCFYNKLTYLLVRTTVVHTQHGTVLIMLYTDATAQTQVPSPAGDGNGQRLRHLSIRRTLWTSACGEYHVKTRDLCHVTCVQNDHR